MSVLQYPCIEYLMVLLCEVELIFDYFEPENMSIILIEEVFPSEADDLIGARRFFL